MKKLTLIVSAIALLIGFSQCKKDNDTPNDNNSRIQITLNANYGGNGSKTTFDPANGSFAWSTSEVEYINVGGSAGYLGKLSNDGAGSNTFTGTITGAVDGETLYFFYLGNGDHAGATTLDFSNQSSGNVTDWHIAIGSATYSAIYNPEAPEYDPEAVFSTTLNMAMAIAYFDLSQFGDGNIYLNGDDVYSTATIDYTSGTITGNSKGYINLGTAGSKYVALIPSTTSETTLAFNSSSNTGSMTFNNGIKPAYFYSNGGNNALEVTAEAGSGIPGTFSVSATKKVFFSKGNLQYNPHGSSTDASGNVIGGTWRFAENQYDAIGNGAGNNVFDGTRSTQNAWIDLFGWGTSGWNNGNTDYLPYNNWYTTASTYGYGYGPKSGYSTNYALIGDFANADWGVYNTISNAGTGWRTLTGGTTSDAEWYYLLFTRTASTIGETENARFAKGNVNNVHGVIVFPDTYSHPSGVAMPTGINMTGSDAWNSNNYDLDAWVKMEAAGAVFLPVTGRTENATVYVGYNPVGYYWSASNNSTSKAYGFYFGSGQLECSSYNRYYGYAVRLVKDVE